MNYIHLKNLQSNCWRNKRCNYFICLHNLYKIETIFNVKKNKFSILKNSKNLDEYINYNNKKYIFAKYRFFSNSKKENVVNKNLENENSPVNYNNTVTEENKCKLIEEKDIDENNINDITKKKKKFSKLKIFAYSFNIIFFSYVIYKVYKNDMNLSKAEESIIRDFVKLFYSYEEKNSVKNSQFLTCLNEDLSRQIAMYFIQLDTDKSSGFLINDAVNFLSELNINEDNEIIKKFIKKGNGKSIELKKLSGCSLQEFAELIESLILVNKTKNETYLSKRLSSLENEKTYYIDVLQYYLDSIVNFVKTSKIFLYYQSKKKKTNEDIKQIDNLEKLILDKLIQYNEKYVDKKNLSLDYLLSKEELNYLKNNNLSKKKEEKEILLVEKKILEDKIQILNNLQLKKNLTEAEIKRLEDLKVKLKNLKKTIRKEELKKYFFL
ncbi:conserved Plasmodium protein, unknown function [Plasmodium gallinaceum]|uniref:Uncharacterized protein n=1 Tax=Plasmodium gallinaceum TaxID=5849 RepID=A0A1J1H050_PLAGA|nr:conserved Plasmodium protein, unknown function [Plasmodium gallinaceum]CRG98068.1 conserved Plasmodium protein, unknown function [Plasmodium gallinaceum]